MLKFSSTLLSAPSPYHIPHNLLIQKFITAEQTQKMFATFRMANMPTQCLQIQPITFQADILTQFQQIFLHNFSLYSVQAHSFNCCNQLAGCIQSCMLNK